MVPGTYAKTSNVITFYHKNGMPGSLVTDASAGNKIINIVNQSDLSLVSEYLVYLNDFKNNPELSCAEVASELKKLEVELDGKLAVSKSGASAKIRQEAFTDSETLVKRIRLLGILHKQMKCQKFKWPKPKDQLPLDSVGGLFYVQEQIRFPHSLTGNNDNFRFLLQTAGCDTGTESIPESLLW